MAAARSGAVIFTGDKDRLARFYEAVTGLPVFMSDDRVTVLASEHFELVIHALRGEPAGDAALVRQDAHVKPFFAVASLAETREKATALGGSVRPLEEEWEARGFRACEAVDPDGNAIQVRQVTR